MTRLRWFRHAAVLAALCLPVAVTAGEHGQGGTRGDATATAPIRGAVAVRDVRVRDVQVRDVVVSQPKPAVDPRRGAPRPFLPEVISRPGAPLYVPNNYYYPQRSDSSRYRRRPHAGFAPGPVIGYPVIVGYEDPFVDSTTVLTPVPTYVPSPVMPPPRYNDSDLGGLIVGTARYASIDCGLDPGAPPPCGGISFDVLPGNAQVSVEGVFVGTVESFPASQPLVLAPGVHYVEVRLPGHRTAVLDVTISAGEVIPYRGTLVPLRTR